MSRLPTITETNFAPFGSVHEPQPGSRDAAIARWTDLAAARYASALEPRRIPLPAAGPVTVIEVHPASPQLTVSFDASWTIRVLPEGKGPADVPGARFHSFHVPAGVGVILNGGLWHTPVLADAATEVLVIFRQGTTEHGTDWIELEDPLEFGDPD
jgi:ureidoglycolate hydrolase